MDGEDQSIRWIMKEDISLKGPILKNMSNIHYIFQKVILLISKYKNICCYWGHPALWSCARLTHSAVCLKFSVFLKFSGKVPR